MNAPSCPAPHPQPYNPNQRGNTATNGGLIDRWRGAEERRESLLQSALRVCVCVSECLSNGIRGREERRRGRRQRGRSFSRSHVFLASSPAFFPANPLDLFHMCILGKNPWEMFGEGRPIRVKKLIRNLIGGSFCLSKWTNQIFLLPTVSGSSSSSRHPVGLDSSPKTDISPLHYVPLCRRRLW